jgi:hypothetical protein
MTRTLRAVLAALAVVLLTAVLVSPAAAMDEQQTIVTIAYQHIGDRFRLGASGPTRFDCSGFVWFTFKTAGLEDRIGGKPVTARQFQKYFRDRGLLSSDPKTARVGDLVFYGNPAKHSGIVTRIDAKGRPHVTSALTTGVKETKYNTLDVRFDSFAHVGLGGTPDPTPSPTPTPTPSPTTSPTPTTSADASAPPPPPSSEPSPSA